MIHNERQTVQQLHGIIGHSYAIQQAVDRLLQVAPTDLTVLITGESGTGKEIFAKAIHALSKRSRFSMISVNCGAIPATLLESELFGHERGAFTGAVEQRKGFFETAHRGTIFLDEVGEMAPDTQVKFLRVLESGEFSRVGSSEMHQVDVRIIAATNKNLEEAVRRGTVRQDLFYRLNAVRINLPSLHERPEDIPPLTEHFAKRTAEKLHIPFEGISGDAMRLLMNLPWPGNIRELKNMVETLVVLEQGRLITPEMIRPYLPLALKAAQSLPQDTSLMQRSGTYAEQIEREFMYRVLLEMRDEIGQIKNILLQNRMPLHELPRAREEPDIQSIEGEYANEDEYSSDFIPQEQTKEENLRLDEMEQKLILTALRKYRGNRRLAAQALGISERTLYRKLHEYNLLEGNE